MISVHNASQPTPGMAESADQSFSWDSNHQLLEVFREYPGKWPGALVECNAARFHFRLSSILHQERSTESLQCDQKNTVVVGRAKARIPVDLLVDTFDTSKSDLVDLCRLERAAEWLIRESSAIDRYVHTAKHVTPNVEPLRKRYLVG